MSALAQWWRAEEQAESRLTEADRFNRARRRQELQLLKLIERERDRPLCGTPGRPGVICETETGSWWWRST